MSNPFLTQANAILACPHVRWEPQARQLIPVIEGLVKELLDAQMDTRRLDWIEQRRASLYYFRTCSLISACAADGRSGNGRPTLREAVDSAAPLLHETFVSPTPATSGTHQPDSVTGEDALVAGGSFKECPICRGTGYHDFLNGDAVHSVECPRCQQPEPTTTIP
jgi:hypothetical protein